MSDLISRQFVELIVEYPDPELCTYKEYRGKPYYSIKYIENGETYVGYGTYNPEVLSRYLREYFMPSAQPEWIPCSERLPEEDGQYLITVKYKHVDGYDDIYAEHGEWYDGKWDMFFFGHCGEAEGIIAWMPLPEPYKGDKDE